MKPHKKTLSATFHSIPEGKAGVLATLDAMKLLVHEYKKSLVIRELALSLTLDNLQKAYFSEVKAIHAYVRDKIRYVKDIRGIETLHTPETLLQLGQGDCDDKSTLTATLLESIGHKTRFEAVGFRPGAFSHVLVSVKLGDKWLPLETTEPVGPGWYPPRVVEKIILEN